MHCCKHLLQYFYSNRRCCILTRSIVYVYLVLLLLAGGTASSSSSIPSLISVYDARQLIIIVVGPGVYTQHAVGKNNKWTHIPPPSPPPNYPPTSRSLKQKMRRLLYLKLVVSPLAHGTMRFVASLATMLYVFTLL